MFQLQHSLKSLCLKLSPTRDDRWVWTPPAERTTSGSRKRSRKIHTVCSVFFYYHQTLQTEWLIKKEGFSSSQFWRQRGSDQMQMDIPHRVLRCYKPSHGEKSSSWRWYQSELHSRSALNDWPTNPSILSLCGLISPRRSHLKASLQMKIKYSRGFGTDI